MYTQIYSIQTVAEAWGCVEAGVDFIGLAAGTEKNLPAEISLARGREIFDAVKGKIGRIALAVADTGEEIIEMVRALDADMVQVCGNHFAATPQFCRDIKAACPGVAVIQAVGITGREAIAPALAFGAFCDALILDSVDTAIAGIGAAGIVNDWDVCAEIIRGTNCRVILAGGLGPENVAQAIAKTRPWCVDSLTRTSKKHPDGTMEKDMNLVRAFVQNARRAAKELGL